MKVKFSMRLCKMLAMTFVFVSGVARADFELGLQYYAKGEFEKAHREFSQAAKFGDPASQLNLGVMYYRGEFVAQDPIQAYAWLALAAQAPEYAEKGLHRQIYQNFSAEQKRQADEAYQGLLKRYSAAAIDESLNPVLLEEKEGPESVRVLKQVHPQYPKKMLNDLRLGHVDIFLTIAKDGSTKDHVVNSSSDKAFSQVVLDSIRQWQYQPALINGRPVETHGHKVSFRFTIEGMGYDEAQIEKVLSVQREKALAGNAMDQFTYGFFLEILPTFTKFKPRQGLDENPNKWYMLAAKNGHVVSSFFLGQNILNGKMCVPEPEKSIAWLSKAATKGLIDAQYLLAVELISGARLQKNEEQGMYWLNIAASGQQPVNAKAKLKLAWILSTHPNKSQRDGGLALKYLKDIAGDYADKQTLYRTFAAVYAENDDFVNAMQWQEKALNDAKSLGLPTELLQVALENYRNKQAFRESL
ncbi:SEL1-like repeat protein [Undibacterium sp. LX40W]|uniref:SEL1-like repeat protein n=1 Tax=Undibacterium nitidum TaxID=2762298 RepID=A0A923HXA4_9BURK|nr:MULTISPECIES: energy transducer TonB [Undibacterium]MBC3881891.1 SEL1-like repeat protein [Undibacterium nitidum]MBC3892112.1 SEL1-like repeat protein [Undibacterium sp. LX40W]